MKNTTKWFFRNKHAVFFFIVLSNLQAVNKEPCVNWRIDREQQGSGEALWNVGKKKCRVIYNMDFDSTVMLTLCYIAINRTLQSAFYFSMSFSFTVSWTSFFQASCALKTYLVSSLKTKTCSDFPPELLQVQSHALITQKTGQMWFSTASTSVLNQLPLSFMIHSTCCSIWKPKDPECRSQSSSGLFHPKEPWYQTPWLAWFDWG